eukprot:358486-Chlamydomonas_euryale.AAC.26
MVQRPGWTLPSYVPAPWIDAPLVWSSALDRRSRRMVQRRGPCTLHARHVLPAHSLPAWLHDLEKKCIHSACGGCLARPHAARPQSRDVVHTTACGGSMHWHPASSFFLSRSCFCLNLKACGSAARPLVPSDPYFTDPYFTLPYFTLPYFTCRASCALALPTGRSSALRGGGGVVCHSRSPCVPTSCSDRDFVHPSLARREGRPSPPLPARLSLHHWSPFPAPPGKLAPPP